jgi:hypothetical protein
VLVQVTRDHDARRRRAQLVEQRAGTRDLDLGVAAVQADGAEPGAGDLDRVADALHGVVGVDEQGRAGAERGDLRPERLDLAGVGEGEGVRARARGRDRVAPARLEVARLREARDVRRPGSGDGSLLVRPAPAHLEQRDAPGRPAPCAPRRRPRRCRG